MAQMPTPSVNPVVDPRTGKLAREWIRYFDDLQAEAGGTSPIDPSIIAALAAINSALAVINSRLTVIEASIDGITAGVQV